MRGRWISYSAGELAWIGAHKEAPRAELLARQDNGARAGWLVRLGRAVTSVTASISTRLADGFSSGAKVCRR